MRVVLKPILAISHDHKARTTTVYRELHGIRIAKITTLPGILTRKRALAELEKTNAKS